MMNEEMIIRTEQWVKEKLAHDRSGHDWEHIRRVRDNALYIARIEGGNCFVIELAALLHDVVDDKLVDDVDKAYRELREWLALQGMDAIAMEEIIHIISTMSFKGGGRPSMSTLEGKIVQDADRLDAIGAIGIARTFMYAGAKGHAMYDEEVKVRETLTEKEYRQGKSTAVHHFYEKLLKLKDLMNTSAAKQLAEERHEHMERFLQQFMKEWNGLQ
ncbi:HD domain-containing protein [Bacillus songklensis]|uniref:HD domain-containing protein n=1 Tax=Bacillus songklensis TaxID=1069116 RepID=A0ABV8B7T6_9BACI